MITYTDIDSGDTIDARNLEDAVTAFSANAIAGPAHPATESDGTMTWCATIYHKQTMRKIGQFVWPRQEGETS